MKSIREIALLSGTSTATVSRYVNKTGSVSDKTASKIQAVIDEHGYIPNKLTQAIIENDSKMIGLIVENVTNPFFPELLNEIGAEVEKLGYTLVVCNTSGDIETEQNFVIKLSEFRVSGFIVVNSLDPTIYENVKIPIVSVERKISNSSFIVSDNKKGAMLATKALINRGRKKLLFISNLNLNEVTKIRRDKFIEICKFNNIEFNYISKDIDDITYDDISQYDGIFCWNDLSAHRVLALVSKNGKSVPEDVSVVGFDNLDLNNLFAYKLTTINQDLANIGRESIRLLNNLINKHSYEEIIVDTDFVDGDTL